MTDLDVTYDGTNVSAGPGAREQFYDSRGYGRPKDGGLELETVEAAHLLFREDLESVRDTRPADERPGPEYLDFHDFLASAAVSEVSFFIYAELRERGFYLSPLSSDQSSLDAKPLACEFEVYPRGQGPWDDDVAYHVFGVSEREAIPADTLRELATISHEGNNLAESAALAVVDEESEVTYLEVAAETIAGSTYHDISPVEGALLSDRVLVESPPAALHEQAFYGQRLDRDADPVQLSLVEAAFLSERGVLELSDATASNEDIVQRGREVEGERFDRRLRVYSALRTAGVVPKTGFKFGADFRTYADVESAEDLGHSELLVRVLLADHSFSPRDLALDVRLAHGVRKRMVFALAGDDGLDWLSVTRLTP
jgi:tRNA-intron endonuclease